MSVGSTRSASLPTSSPSARAAACCSSSSSLLRPAMSWRVSSGRMMRSALGAFATSVFHTKCAACLTPTVASARAM